MSTDNARPAYLDDKVFELSVSLRRIPYQLIWELYVNGQLIKQFNHLEDGEKAYYKLIGEDKK